ncbi:MAG: hypothetical protein IKJ26_06100 [Clostridia bacterium]|nr:hypothetical protein [Clostridia bacterium]
MNNASIDELTFQGNDALGREKYADFLIEAIKIGKSDEGSYTIAIDAPYGSGKTWFLKMLEQKINREYASTQIPCPLVAVRYDAWKYDYFNEPLVPVVEQIMQSSALADEKKFVAAKSLMSKVLTGVKNLAKFDWTSIIDDLPPQFKAVPAIIQCFEAGGQVSVGLEEAKNLKQYQAALMGLQMAMHQAATTYGDNARLVVIIDELDRCRPDYAIRTLEVAKHLLSSSNVVFLYAVDVKQLCKTVEKLYGNGIDAEGYLLRFFDYISVMPKIPKTKYIRNKLDSILETRFAEVIEKELENKEMFFDFSYRDIDRILSTFEMFAKQELKKYDNPSAFVLYFYMLALKYKKRDYFDKAIGMAEIRDSREEREWLETIVTSDLKTAITSMLERKVIEYCDDINGIHVTHVCADRLNKTADFYIFPYSDTNHEIKYRQKDELRQRTNHFAYFDVHYSHAYGIIFYQDAKELFNNKSKYLTCGEYVHQKLEMYNFYSEQKTTKESNITGIPIII